MSTINIKAAVIAGTVAGVASGLVKLGWENILPPRTPARNQTNPPQRLLEQFGVPAKVTHATYTYSDTRLPWVSYLIHFGFSTTFGALYSVAGHYLPVLRLGQGTLFGLGVWGAFHLGIMPAMGTVPNAKQQPVEEHVSEALGHMAWMWTNHVISDAVYRQLTKGE
ncbi:DUF1440 domain-containing protein [Secundilactobacillus folii]|uniref:DUF1440 domain-containing protein n=1 Tax=Secundilactobacillus folii TaxID=2678357 RepID=A0A7X2XXL3_9LACO|nr:DUF1440 domain-containing protein [Secundilactobacillus folii]MTV82798.1 DUF1440 domain-containing protein [Secundilactobacillus folii]